MLQPSATWTPLGGPARVLLRAYGIDHRHVASGRLTDTERARLAKLLDDWNAR